MIPHVLEDEDEARGQRDPDILAEERERRLRQRRGLRALWLGNWLTGRTGVVFLCIFLVAGLGWMVFQRMDPARSDVRVDVSAAAAAPERVRDLTASRTRAGLQVRGSALRGSGRDAGGAGRVHRGGPGDDSPSRRSLMLPLSMSPLPGGGSSSPPVPGGMACGGLICPRSRPLQPLTSFDRRAWLERQETELERVVGGISAGIGLLRGLELEIWEPGYGAPILELSSWIGEPYPPAHFGHWDAVPGLWVCDGVLELDLHQGVGPGCPGGEYTDALRDAWFHAGNIVDRMERIGRFVNWMDGMISADLYESNVRMELAYELLDLFRDYRDLDLSLARLRAVSREWGLAIAVDFGGGG